MRLRSMSNPNVENQAENLRDLFPKMSQTEFPGLHFNAAV